LFAQGLTMVVGEAARFELPCLQLTFGPTPQESVYLPSANKRAASEPASLGQKAAEIAIAREIANA
jgi:hypothetical protein